MDFIHLLPDSITNQFSVREIIQGPASVVKELVENAVDAGANDIQIIIKDFGQSLIQVIDNGKGMSSTDARLAFEKRATSKICNAKDFLTLRTMGFRGMALASIAAIAQVELKTRQKKDETGTFIQISASQIEKQEATITQSGSIFSVKNLFYNVPALEKSLKSNKIEFKNILTEFKRIALAKPQIAFTFRHNDEIIIFLPISNLKQRIVNLMGGRMKQSLLSVNINTSFMQIYGFVGVPTSSKKRNVSQYFFTNGRYMNHTYFYQAVISAFKPFLPTGKYPDYFLYIEIDPTNIDVDIHPAKTEIKFKNERTLFQIIFSVVKESIAFPTLEFDQEKSINIPIYTKKDVQTTSPLIRMRSNYNPFKETCLYKRSQINWKQFDLKNQTNNKICIETISNHITYLQYKGKYLILSLKSEIMFIDQRRAHIRILFDDYIQRINHKKGFSQKLLSPKTISFTTKEAAVLPYILDDLDSIGFDLTDLGNNTYSINSIPTGLENINIIVTLQEIIGKILDTNCEIKEKIKESLAIVLAQKTAISYGKKFSEEETHTLVVRLFSSISHNYTPDGKLIIFTLSEEELNKKFYEEYS